MSRKPSLLLRVGTRLCAVPLPDVAETMRPLPVEPIADAPPFVRGVAVIRGAPVPVVDAAALLGGTPAAAPARFLTLRAGDHVIALAVDAVLGTRDLGGTPLIEPTPLLCAGSAVDRLGALDAQLLQVLRTACILPEETWQAIAGAGAAQ